MKQLDWCEREKTLRLTHSATGAPPRGTKWYYETRLTVASCLARRLQLISPPQDTQKCLASCKLAALSHSVGNISSRLKFKLWLCLTSSIFEVCM